MYSNGTGKVREKSGAKNRKLCRGTGYQRRRDDGVDCFFHRKENRYRYR